MLNLLNGMMLPNLVVLYSVGTEYSQVKSEVSACIEVFSQQETVLVKF